MPPIQSQMSVKSIFVYGLERNEIELPNVETARQSACCTMLCKEKSQNSNRTDKATLPPVIWPRDSRLGQCAYPPVALVLMNCFILPTQP